ncbi:MAG: hypothetical protein ACHQ01_09845 [Candidatus Limnocylindrales bacterium]
MVADTGDANWTTAKRAAEVAIRGLPGLRVDWLTADHDVHAAMPDEVAGILLEAFAGR